MPGQPGARSSEFLQGDRGFQRAFQMQVIWETRTAEESCLRNFRGIQLLLRRPNCLAQIGMGQLQAGLDSRG